MHYMLQFTIRMETVTSYGVRKSRSTSSLSTSSDNRSNAENEPANKVSWEWSCIGTVQLTTL